MKVADINKPVLRNSETTQKYAENDWKKQCNTMKKGSKSDKEKNIE